MPAARKCRFRDKLQAFTYVSIKLSYIEKKLSILFKK